MITKQMAIDAMYSEIFHHVTAKNADGTPTRCRKNGACKVWKTRPTEFRLPVKHGLRTCFYITQDNADEWVISDE